MKNKKNETINDLDFIYSLTITTTFVAFHKWPKAPKEVAFLRNLHRHVFHVRAVFPVTASDRELEFFILKNKLNEYINRTWQNTESSSSCEMMGAAFLTAFPEMSLVHITEDGENGAIVKRRN